jgi:hypothetical protein
LESHSSLPPRQQLQQKEEQQRQNNHDDIFDRKLSLLTSGLDPYYSRTLSGLPTGNALVIIDYLLAMKTEKNLSLHFTELVIKALNKLCVFCKYKHFSKMDRENILAFLDSYRKTDAFDPLHKWIGTYNLYRTVFVTFFKWLHYPDIEPKKRPKPPCIDNIPKLKRKETSIYKATDLWTQLFT